MSNSYKEYASKEYVNSVVVSKENIEQIVAGFLAEAKAYASQVNEEHNIATDSHNDIRELITGLTTRLNTLADSDDTTLDQLSEIIAFIKSNKDLIDAITTDRIRVTDIVNDLTTNDATKPLSAAQGVVIKELFDGIRHLPEVTTDDNDKALVVEEGVWVAKKIESGTSSWNDLTDKPFGEETVNFGDTLTWDGTPTDVNISLGDIMLCHVSDSIPTSDEAIGGTFMSSDGEEYSITEDFISLTNETGGRLYVIGDGNIAVSTEDNFSMNGIIISRKGVYFMLADGTYTTSFTIPNYNFTKKTVKPIDSKFLPEGGFGCIEPSVEILPETIVSSDETSGNMYILIPQINIEDGQIYHVKIDGVTTTQVAKVEAGTDGFVTTYIGNLHLTDGDYPDTGEDFILYNHSSTPMGTIILHRTIRYPETIVVGIKRGDKVNRIDTKYLPQYGFGYEERVSDTHGDKLTWSGQTTDTSLVLDEVFGEQNLRIAFAMVSDVTPTIEQIQEATVGITNQGQYSDHIISDNQFVRIDDYGSYYRVTIEIISFFVVRTPGAVIEDRYVAPEKGIYFTSLGGVLYISSLTIPGYGLFKPTIAHKIDAKFLPDTVATKADIQSYIDNAILNGAW